MSVRILDHIVGACLTLQETIQFFQCHYHFQHPAEMYDFIYNVDSLQKKKKLIDTETRVMVAGGRWK